MKHNHHHEDLRSAGLKLKHGRSESLHPATRARSDAGSSDDGPPESNTATATGSGQGTGALSDQQRVELRHTSERNKDCVNPIQSSWPTPST